MTSKIDELEDESAFPPHLPHEGAKMLKLFFATGDMLPLAPNNLTALQSIKVNANRVKNSYKHPVPKKVRRAFESTLNCIDSLTKLFVAMKMMGYDLGLGMGMGMGMGGGERVAEMPTVVYLDLSMRQKERHYDRGLLYQGIFYNPMGWRENKNSKNNSNSNNNNNNATSEGVKIVEGGRFEELIRKYRPPGNFGSTSVESYTSTALPIAMGVRFFIGKIVECLYISASRVKVSERSERGLMKTSM